MLLDTKLEDIKKPYFLSTITKFYVLKGLFSGLTFRAVIEGLTYKVENIFYAKKEIDIRINGTKRNGDPTINTYGFIIERKI